MTFEAVLGAIEALPPAAALRSSFIAYPLVNAAHILGAGALVALVWLMHAARRRNIRRSFGSDRFFRRFVILAIVAMVLTGAALFSVKAGEYTENPAFRIKMLLIAAALANAGLYRLVRQIRPPSTVLSVLIWPAILVAGRFIGFV